MSDSNPFGFGKVIPGFDFLKNLASASGGPKGPMSGLANWVAPTVSVEELDKRITELKAVQFWLEQNGTALKATIQALEVQKMTLATLSSMNMSMVDVAKAFTIPTPDSASTAQHRPVAAAAPAHSAADAAQPWPFSPVASAAAPAEAAPAPAPAMAPEVAQAAAPAPAAPAAVAEGAAAPGVPDPMQWWGALAQQFQQIAATAMRDAAHLPNPLAASAAPQAGAASSAEAAAAPSARKRARAAGTSATAKKKAKPAAKASSAGAAAQKKPSGAAARSAQTKRPAQKAAVKKTPAKKAAPKKRAAAKPATTAADVTRSLLGGWPLPPPFKLGG